MKKYIFYISYILLLICSTLYSGTIAVGSISYRHILTILVLFIIATHGSKWLKLDKYFKLFFAYLIFVGLASIITGHGEIFIMKIFGTYLTCYTIYQASKLLIMQYKEPQILVYTLLSIGILDSVVTIFQYLQNPIGYAIPQIMGVDFAEEYADFAARRDSLGETDFVVRGIIGASEHAYFSSCMSVMALYNKKGSINIWNIALWALFIIAVFFIQERTGLFFGFVGSVYVIYVLLKNSGESHGLSNILMKIVGLGVFFGVIYYLSKILQVSDNRYLAQGFDDGGRSEFVNQSIDFLISNPLGGFDEYIDKGNGYPHNLLINSWLYGGFIGGSIAIYLTIIQAIFAFKEVIFKRKNINSVCLIFGVMYLVYTGNSLFHNLSLATGASVIWGYWAFFVSSNSEQINVR